MTGTVAQISILQTCQSTSNSNDLQPPGPNMESTPLGTNRTLQKLWSTLVPYLSVDMAEFIVSSPESNLRVPGKKQELTVLFADIRGFTSLAEVLDPEDCVSILNDSQLFDFARAWAGILLASAFGIAMYAGVALVEHLTTGWAPSARRFRSE